MSKDNFKGINFQILCFHTYEFPPKDGSENACSQDSLLVTPTLFFPFTIVSHFWKTNKFYFSPILNFTTVHCFGHKNLQYTK